jgi:signal transduction histidine kinase
MNQSPQKILIVEDEALIALQIEEQLEQFGYKVVSQITYGEEVLEEAKKCVPDLIMMDINLKGKMTGIEAAHQVRSFSNIPIIFLTAYGDKKMLEEAKQTSPHGFLTKPFRSQELNAAVELSLIRHQTEEDLKIKQEQFEKLATDNDNQLLKAVPGLMEILFTSPTHKNLWSDKKEILSSISKDIDKIKEHQSSAVETNNEAEITNKTKDEFLSRMNHEFRTPLNSIMGFSQILNSETDNPLNDSQKEKVNSIMDSGNHILKLVNNILDQKTIEKDTLEINFEEISLNRLIEEAFDAVKESSSKKRLHIIYETPSDEEIWVSADQAYLKKVFTHLLNNAIKYNRNNGNIGISIKFNDSQIITLTISDSGTGIPLEKQNKIFKPFNGINPNHNYEEGIGLSLSISKALIEMMNGKISFESQLGKGSKFFIKLPLIKKTNLSLKNINNEVSSISSYNALLEKEISQETGLFNISIPEEMRLDFLKAAEIYNYSALESLINDLSSYSEDGKLFAELAKKHLNQYDVENIIELFNKIKQDS